MIKHQSLCYSIVENLVEPVDSNLVSFSKQQSNQIKPNKLNQSIIWVRCINSDQYIILGFDTELQIVNNGKQYTDITADDFSKFIE